MKSSYRSHRIRAHLSQVAKAFPKVFYFVFAVALYAILSRGSHSHWYAPPTPTSPSKQVIVNTLPLREIWRWSGFIASLENDPPKIIVKDKLIILAAEVETGRSENQTIIAFDADTGSQIWASRPTFDRPHSLAVDDERVYVSYLMEVWALDLKSGERLWTGAKQDQWKRGGLNVYLQDSRVEVYDLDLANSPANSYLFFLDPKTGITLETIEWGGIFFHHDDFYYSSPSFRNSFQNWIGAKRLRAKFDVIWETDFSGGVRRWPIVVNDIMYLDAYDIYAVNPETGDIYWQYKIQGITNQETDPPTWYYTNYFVSKMAYGANTIYLVESDGSVVGLEPETGHEKGKIKITPSPNYFNSENRFNYNICHTIAASDEFVAVYYGDSQELIVFKQE